MNYFVDDETWDIIGYYDNLKKISNRLGDSYELLSDLTFHDFRLKTLEISESKELVISVQLYLHNPYENEDYIIVWKNVSKYQVCYDASDYVFANVEKVVTDDGYGAVAQDEITAYDAQFLQHEILLASGMKIQIVGEKIDIQRK